MALLGFGTDSHIQKLCLALKDEMDRLRENRYISDSWRIGSFVSSEDPIVIGGCPRSGTTLMSVIMNSRADTYCGPEDTLLLNWDFSLQEIARDYGYEFSQLLTYARQ